MCVYIYIYIYIDTRTHKEWKINHALIELVTFTRHVTLNQKFPKFYNIFINFDENCYYIYIVLFILINFGGVKLGKLLGTPGVP